MNISIKTTRPAKKNAARNGAATIQRSGQELSLARFIAACRNSTSFSMRSDKYGIFYTTTSLGNATNADHPGYGPRCNTSIIFAKPVFNPCPAVCVAQGAPLARFEPGDDAGNFREFM